MAKVKTAFFCKHCGTQHSKWQGQCHACKEWNTIVEEVLQKPKNETWQVSRPVGININSISIYLQVDSYLSDHEKRSQMASKLKSLCKVCN